MKVDFGSIEKADTLYIVYKDLNNEYQIGEGKVTGFHNWTYTIGDRWEDWGEKEMTNIDYEFNGINFSSSLEYSLNKTHFTDSPVYNSKYDHILKNKYIETFTTYNEAKEYIIAKLSLYIDNVSKQIEKLNEEIEKYQCNLIKIKSK